MIFYFIILANNILGFFSFLSNNKLIANFKDISLSPNTLSFLSWIDSQNNLLMAKIRANVEKYFFEISKFYYLFFLTNKKNNYIFLRVQKFQKHKKPIYVKFY